MLSYLGAKERLSWTGPRLLQRKQQVSINGVLSEYGIVVSGMPRGSALGPTVFTYM